MKLERHVGGLSRARKLHYLEQRGWVATGEDLWACVELGFAGVSLDKATHHQLTLDLARGLASSGWSILSFSPRGYARLENVARELPACSLPKALRLQARREGRPVGELTYGLFLAALLDGSAGPLG